MPKGSLVAAVCAFALVAFAPVDVSAADAGIEGSYKLVKRVLPDGKEVEPPAVTGFMTYTKGYRNFNVMWKGDDGKPTSVGYVSKYKLNNKEYCETPIYWMQNNLMEPGIKYEAPADKSKCAAVTMKDGRPSFRIHGEPVVMKFTKDGFLATAEGQFEDHWKKVD